MLEVQLRVDFDDLKLDAFSINLMMELVESTVAKIFAQEMSHIDISVIPYTEIEQHDTPLLVKILLDGDDLNGPPARLAEEFAEAWNPVWRSEIARDSPDHRFRVWVLPVIGGHLYEPETRPQQPQDQR